ncbi:MAG: hypothetical protein AB7N24_14680 [Dehalococcoidia bacterium]
MRLKPPPTANEAHQLLSANATLVWGAAAAAEISANLRAIAEAMAVVAALDIPDETEPLFGEDPAVYELE